MARDTAYGDEIEDAIRGGRGERFTLLHAFAGYVANNGRHRAPFIPGPLEWPRGVAVDSSTFLPWFERVVSDASALFKGGTSAAHLDNSRVHMYSTDFNQGAPAIQELTHYNRLFRLSTPWRIRGATGRRPDN